ncbi:MAG: NAD(P)-dependent alcohol dehydrogenase [Gaiellaceae bacterium]
MKITAAVVESAGASFALQELELGELRDDEVLVKVAASGICHTDLICRDQWYPVPLPAVLGHEGAGVVEAVGRGVTAFAPGDRVGMSYDSCGRCPTCSKDLGVYCHEFFEHNFAASRAADGSSALSRDGELIHAHFFGQSSFATHSVARQTNVVLLDDAIPLDVAAPFGCGIQTGAGSVLNVMRPPAGSSIAVFGAGAVGLAAVMAAKIAGCTTIVAVDIRQNRLDFAREVGATHVVDASQTDAVEAIRALTGSGADFSLEATGVPQVLRSAVDCLTPTGVCGVVGAPAFGAEVSLDVNTILTGGRVVRGIVEGESVPSEFLPRLVELWRRGQFPVDRMMIYYDFDQIDQAAHDAEAGTVIKPVLRIG